MGGLGVGVEDEVFLEGGTFSLGPRRKNVVIQTWLLPCLPRREEFGQ